MLKLLTSNPAYARFWSGFTLSAIGDAMTRVALTWYVLERTGSPAALGLLTVMYTAPILLGGLAAGPILDRFGPRRVMVADNALRGGGILAIAVLAATGGLEVWHAYAFAALYGSLMMVSLAGSPTIIPLLVRPEELDAANALETLSYTVSGVVGAPVAGFLLASAGLSATVLVDAVTYLLFALLLLGAPGPARVAPAGRPSAPATRGGPPVAARLLLGNPVLLSTTLMFMAANIGLGMLGVALPLHAQAMAPGRPQAYGVLLGVLAAGEVVGACLAGTLRLRLALGARIALSQAVAGVSLLLVAAGPWGLSTGAGLVLLGLFSAPLTIWAQTLRMRVIPPEARGRTFALLRTLMQGATPLGGALAGLLVSGVGEAATAAVCAVVVAAPGVVGLTLAPLRRAGAGDPP